MKISNNALITQRNTINSWFIFLSGLFGSVFGFMGSISSLMSFIEGFSEKWAKQKFKKKKIRRIKLFRKNYKRAYKHNSKSKNQYKILPMSFNIKLYDKKETSNLSIADHSIFINQ